MPTASPYDAWYTTDVVALILAALTVSHLFRQREEPGVQALMVLVGAVAAHAALNLIMVSTGSRGVAITMAELQYAPQAVDTLAWITFALIYTGRHKLLRSWPMALVAVMAAATTLMAFTGDPMGWLIAGGAFDGQTSVSSGQGALYGFVPWFGTWKSVHQSYNWGGILIATAIMALHVAQSPRHLNRLVFVFGAPLVAALANTLHGPFPQIPDWVSLQPLGHAFAAAALSFGLLRAGDTTIAPVARNVVLEEMQDGVVVIGGDGVIVDANRAARERLGLVPLGKVPLELGTTWTAMKAKLQRLERPFPERVILPVEEGIHHTFEVSVTPLGPKGGRDRTVMVLRDINQQVIVERELRAASLALRLLAHTDELTTLANRRHLLERLTEEVERSRRYEHPLSIILLDLDHFKRVNDTWGHAVGDQVLRATADTMEEICREQDVAGRMGGEEFAVLLPETDSEGARIVADRLRLMIAQRMHEADDGETFRVTASMGVATLGPGAKGTVESLMRAADEALYAAKGDGRNRVALSA